MFHTSSHEAARTFLEKIHNTCRMDMLCIFQVALAGFGTPKFHWHTCSASRFSFSVRWLMDAPVPAVASVEEAVDYLRQLEECVYDLSTAVRHLQASLNATSLRIDTLEQQVARLEFQTSGSHGGGIRAELAIVSRIVSDVVEQSNRAEAEIRLLLSWRTRFSKVLQDELRSIGFRFASACPNFEPAYLDSLD